jgi:hypothetical protein
MKQTSAEKIRRRNFKFRINLFALNLILGNIFLYFAKAGDRGGMGLVLLVFSVVALLLLELAIRLLDRRPRLWIALVAPVVTSILIPMVAIFCWMALESIMGGSFSLENLGKALVYGILMPIAGFVLIIPLAILNMVLFFWRFLALSSLRREETGTTDLVQIQQEKERELQRQWNHLSAITIVGVVGATNVGGIARGENWDLRLELAAWRIPGGPVQQSPLLVTKVMTDVELRDLQDTVPCRSLFAFRGKLCEQSPFGDARALLVERLDAPQDKELEAFLTEYRRPVYWEDAVFGRLLLDKALDWFEGTCLWQGREIQISAAPDGSGNPRASLQTLQALFGSQDLWTSRWKEFACNRLLPVKNMSWLDENEAPLSEETFQAHLQVESIHAHGDSFDVDLSAGNFSTGNIGDGMFYGHSIEVSGTLAAGPDFADLVG